MTKQNSESKSTRSKSQKPSEPEWVTADESEASAVPRVEREPVDDSQLDIVQHAPDEPAWTPVEPQDAPDAVDEPRVAKKAPRAAGAKPARVGGKAPKSATSDVATDAASAIDEPAPHAPERKPKRASKSSAAQPDAAEGTSTQDDAGGRKGTLAEQHAPEVATAVTEPNAAGPLAKKRSLQKFVAERAEQHAGERVDDAPRPASAPVAKRKHGKPASEALQQTPPVVEPELAIPSEAGAVAPADAPTEPASILPSMEQYIAELATMSVAQLSKRHVEMLGKQPRIKNKTWLQRKLAWHEQTKRYGGLSTAAKKRLDELMGQIELPVPTTRTPKSDAPTTRSADDLPLGTRLERKWHDRIIVATRVEGGWSCEGAMYKTLSAAAKKISGSHVSGPAWFGIWRPKGGTR